MIANIYIHIPFCEHICSYCDFSKLFYHKKLVEKYLISLKKEMSLLPTNQNYQTIYIGGGTPSALTIEELEQLFEITDKILLNENYEFTIECNIENLTLGKLHLMKKHRVNRLSIGIQSFNQNDLDFLERNYKVDDIKPIIRNAQELGFSNINIDLIYALPTQNVEDIEKEIKEILTLNIQHISTYSLILEPNTKLMNNGTENIEEEIDRKMYDIICTNLTKNGFEHYEISNFALPGYESQHNLTYWQNKEYYGFGLGASGYISNNRYTNTKSINQYLEGNIRYTEEYQTRKLELENEIILRFRTRYGINKKDFLNKYGFDLKEKYKIQDFINRKVIIETDDNYYISEDYWYLLNEILLRFIEE